ncbi:MAG: hypothetical protein AVDCRST_MAG06-2137 [uncultured Nocardioides sp.]|uniref:Uncharacterized protein n=1 Tax=uncultured Nocardioides sp. TaxID=198441 RepID=A0A6J4P238_9ACTN|nr:MAG: hypothetical protein AVDCRST_MAG06-2137 [uncultured Nocardioides sp.]
MLTVSRCSQWMLRALLPVVPADLSTVGIGGARQPHVGSTVG